MANKRNRPGALPKLTKKLEFQRLNESGTRVYGGQVCLANYKENQVGHLRCGWTIPRYVGNAVVRNRIRRWCREFFRTNLKEGWNPPIDLNLILRKKDKDFYRTLRHGEFQKSLESLVSRVDRQMVR